MNTTIYKSWGAALVLVSTLFLGSCSKEEAKTETATTSEADKSDKKMAAPETMASVTLKIEGMT